MFMFMFDVHVHVSCSCFMFMFHVHVSCSCFMFMFHVHVSCSCFMFMFHVLRLPSSPSLCLWVVVASVGCVMSSSGWSFSFSFSLGVVVLCGSAFVPSCPRPLLCKSKLRSCSLSPCPTITNSRFTSFDPRRTVRTLNPEPWPYPRPLLSDDPDPNP